MINCKFDDGNEASLRHVTADVIVYVEDKVLLVKRSMKLSTEPGKYCLPGGYLDRNEFLTEAVIREAKEETGYEIEDPLLFHIRDYPGDVKDNNRQNVSFTYVSTKAKKVTEAVDWDSEESIWVPLDSIDKMRDLIAFDHWHILNAFAKYQKEVFDVPVMNAYLNFG